ncbi:MAG TPA: L-2-hydroxyglutarate oxidase, partial [Solirubrobacterales bacterium]|nr:L-2-hydroxyglutarate oxidase [Solirubrobacterales bacterium]
MSTEATATPAACDLAVVGGGIVGLAVARELLSRHPGASLCVLEREPRLGEHQTARNSGVIHAGIYYKPGSLKARLCVAGARELFAFCEERGIETDHNGKLIVATSAEELPRLDELERRGRANEVPDLRRIPADEIASIEPHAVGIEALHSPRTGVVDFRQVAEAYAGDVRRAGGSIHTGCPVEGLEAHGDGLELRHPGGATRAGYAVFCAGAWSDRLAVMAGAPTEPRIVPFRGGYRRLRPERAELVRGNLYPVPDPDLPFLGIHLTRTIDGEVLLGPSALLVGARDAYRPWKVRPADLGSSLAWPGTWRLVRNYWRTGASEMLQAVSGRAFAHEANRFVPELRPADFLPGPAGVRAQ